MKIVLLLACLLLVGCVNTSNAQLKVGLIIPVTGTASLQGEEFKNGFDLANEELGGALIIKIEDNKAEPKLTATAAQKLITIDDVDVLFTGLSSPSSTLAPIAEQHGRLMIYGATVDKPALGHSFVFKNYINIERDCSMMAERLKGRRIGFIGLQTDSTIACIEAIERQGVNLEPELFERGQRDYRSLITKLKSEDFDVIFLRSTPAETAGVLKQMHELGITAQIICPQISGVRCDAPEVTEAYGLLLTGALGTDYYLNESSPRIRSFSEKYEARFGRKPTPDAVFAYEDALIIAHAARSCAREPLRPCMRNVIANDTFQGVDGSIRFDMHGIVQRSSAVWVFNGTQWVVDR
jgi:branched-chain amino acid transport system substrate-binding protein